MAAIQASTCPDSNNSGEKSSIVNIQQQVAETSTTSKFEEFTLKIRNECVAGSGIDPELFESAIAIVSDIEVSGGNDAEAPIHEALNWKYTRFTHTAKEPLFAALFLNADDSCWQGKLSKPLFDKIKQKERKYETPTGNGSRAYLPRIPANIRKKIGERYGVKVPENVDFWEWVKANPELIITITEGGKKALSLLSRGYIAIALYGCNGGVLTKDELGEKLATPQLIPDLEGFACEDRAFVLAFDQDEKPATKRIVGAAVKKLKQCLLAAGCTSVVAKWRGSAKGVDDLIVMNGGGEAWDASYAEAVRKLDSDYEAQDATPPKSSRSERKQFMNFLESQWGKRLKYNEMTLMPELDGKPVDLDGLEMQIADEFDLDITGDRACNSVIHLAKRNSYHPVRDYLDEVAQKYPDSPEQREKFNSISRKYFSSIEPLHDAFMAKHMIGATKRIFEPGSKHDTTVVLQGGQGIGKSSFWEALCLKAWFDDTISSSNSGDKDERMKLRRFWFLELAEIEAVFRKKEVSGLRGFLTTAKDNIRLPYGRTIQEFARTSVFVGSVNPNEFLVDPEGHRRFWVIPVLCSFINVLMLKEERDELWAAAVHAYRRGEKNYLDTEQEKRNALLNKKFEINDSWEEVIEFYLEDKTETAVGAIFNDCLKLEPGRHDRSHQMRISQVLKNLGWIKGDKKKRMDGIVAYPWTRKPSTSESDANSQPGSKQQDFSPGQQGGNRVSQPVATNYNPYPGKVLDTLLPLEEDFDKDPWLDDEQENITVPVTPFMSNVGGNTSLIKEAETKPGVEVEAIPTNVATVATSAYCAIKAKVEDLIAKLEAGAKRDEVEDLMLDWELGEQKKVEAALTEAQRDLLHDLVG